MRRTVAFTTIVVVTVVVAVGYLLLAVRQGTGTGEGPPTPGASGAGVTAGSGKPYVAFQRTSIDDGYGTVGVAPYGDPTAPPSPTALTCERIHMSRFSGICLKVDRGVATTAEVLLLGPDMSVQHTLSTPGIPSRARVSPDGRWAATTTFVYGHSYAATEFATQTEIYDMVTGDSLGNVEKWDISYQGQPYEAQDINVWGVTFAEDGDSFYATIRTGGVIHLAEGRLSTKSLAMTDVAAECPSLSPSGALLAYKSASSPGNWQIRVRTLADGSEVVIGESRSVDDQIEWWDEQTVVYGLGRAEGAAGGATTDVWAAPADGSGSSQLLIPAAWSPAVVRPQ